MRLKSLEFENNEEIPEKYTCDGENISPSLEISDVPEEAKSLALIVSDPDAPSGDFVHWLIWNIDPKTTRIEEGSTPENAFAGITDFGTKEYGGPCPPTGRHKYQFNLYALDVILEINNSNNKEDLRDAINGHVIDQCTLVGLYKRN